MKSNDPMLLDTVREYLENNGIYKTKISELQKYIQERIPTGIKAPCAATLSMILRDTFHQFYKKDHAANTKYRDSIYNSKRLWIAKLVT